MTFWCGSGCGSGSCYFVIDLQDANKKLNLKKNFCLLLFEGTFKSFSKIKVKKMSQSCRNQDFSFYFCLVIELTNGYGSGSWRPKNLWIRWIRIRNTANGHMKPFEPEAQTGHKRSVPYVTQEIQTSALG